MSENVMEKSSVYTLLALTAIISILISVGAFTFMKDNFIGPQGLQGDPGQSIVGSIGPQGEPGESIVGPVGPQGEPGESIIGPQGVQGPQGKQGEPFPYEGEWIETYSKSWTDDDLEKWTHTFTSEADFIMIQPFYVYKGDNLDLGFMSVRVYEGQYTNDAYFLLYWADRYGYGGTALMIIGKGTYTIEATTNYQTDIWIKICEFKRAGE